MRALLIRLALVGFTVAALVNPGSFGTVDTQVRLRVARWIRLGGPLRAGAGGIVGRGGMRHPQCGIGQSLALLPFDAIADISLVPLLKRAGLSELKQRQASEALIAFLMQSLLAAGTLVLAYLLLRSFEFGSLASAAGALSLLFGTTCLAYVQCAQENLLLLLLALGSLGAIRQWLRDGRLVWCAAAGAACGLAVPTRLTSFLEIAVFAALVVCWRGNWKRFLVGFLPPVLVAGFLERLYHWYRFGELFSTYTGIAARQYRPPGMPPSFPFCVPFWKGFVGTLFAPDKSVFLFDPLLLLLIAIAVWRWREMERDLRIMLLGLAALFVLYASFYAKYVFFGGDVAWGHRYVLLPVELLALLAVPLLMRYGGNRAAWCVVAASVVLQLASTTMAAGVETRQRSAGLDNGVIWNRAVNVAQLATGTQDARRLAGIPVEWRTWAYLPFQLRLRFPGLARWAIAAWMGLLVCLPVLVLVTLRRARRYTGTS
jgi:4-amino-4-deoxy-L-arabinose transferase-like glycosyltransferase